MEALQGYKTYIILTAALAVVGLNLLGIITKETAEPIMLILAMVGGITISAKVNRLSQVLGKMGKNQ